MVRRVVEAALRSRLASVVVVLGHDRDGVREALADIVDDGRLTFAINQSYRLGQSTSLNSGLSSVPPDSMGAMFLVGDQPLLDCVVIDRLIAAFEAAGGGICHPRFGERPCNPVIFHAKFFSELRRLRGDVGGRAIIGNHRNDVVPVAFSRGTFFNDIDCEADMEELPTADAASGYVADNISLVQSFGIEKSRVVSLCGSGGKTSLMAALARELGSNIDERVLATTTTKMASDEIEGPWRACQADDAASILATTSDDARPVLAYRRRSHDRLFGFGPEVIDEVARSGRFTRILVEADGSRRRPLKAPKSGEPVFPAATDTVVAVVGLSGLGCPLDDEAVYCPERWSVLTGLAESNSVTSESLARVVVHPEGLMRGAPPQARRILFLNQADGQDRLALADIVMHYLPTLGGNVPTCAVVGRLRPEPRIYSVREFGLQTPLTLGEVDERYGF